MTDFLHPQAVPTPESPEGGFVDSKSALEKTADPSQQDVAPSQNEVATSDVQTNSAVNAPSSNPGALQDAGQRTEPIRRNFATSGNRGPIKNNQEEDDGSPKKIVRKESPLLVQYYQSTFIVLITLFLASGYFVLNPLITEFKSTNERIRVKLKEKDDATAFLASVDRSIAAAKSISPETLAKVNEALPKEVQIPILLKLFSQLADQNGVKMSGVQFSPKGADSTSPSYGGYSLASIQISVSIEAPGYSVMRKYLEDLQTNIQLMDVQSISVGGDESTGAFTYSLQLVTYYIQKTTGLAPATSAIPMSAPGAALPPSAPTVSPNEI